MGQTAEKIIKLDRAKLLRILNEAFAEEWLAYYQYWIGAKIVAGLHRKIVEDEFMEHAEEELEHAKKIADRIIQLGGTPLIDPKEWDKNARCKYLPPKDTNNLVMLKQNLQSERCAIMRYKEICDMCAGGKDQVTFHMAYHIMQEELEHEHDIEDLIADLEDPMVDISSKKSAPKKVASKKKK